MSSHGLQCVQAPTPPSRLHWQLACWVSWFCWNSLRPGLNGVVPLEGVRFVWAALTERFEDAGAGFIYVLRVRLVDFCALLGPVTLLLVVGLAFVTSPPWAVALRNVHTDVHSVVTCDDNMEVQFTWYLYSIRKPQESWGVYLMSQAWVKV